MGVIALLAVGGLWGYSQYFREPARQRLGAALPRLDPSTFTRQEVLRQIKLYENSSKLTFNLTGKKTTVAFEDLPEDVLSLALPLVTGGAMAEYYPETGTYVAHFYSGVRVSDNHTRLLDLAGQANGYSVTQAAYGLLYAVADLSSEDYVIRFSQEAVEETRTDVTVYAKKTHN